MGTYFKNNYSKEHHGSWKGGIIRYSHGYILQYSPNHPHAQKKGIRKGYILQHRLVMERKLKRFLLPKEVVHHINEDKHNNRISNLMLFKNINEHIKFHNSRPTKKSRPNYILKV